MRIKVKLWLRKKKRKKKNPEVSTVTLKGRKLVPRCGEPREGGRSGVPQQRPVPRPPCPCPPRPLASLLYFRPADKGFANSE